MAPKPFTSNVYALDGTFGVANPESQQMAPPLPSELQSVFALDGSAAQTRRLPRRRVQSTPWNQGRLDRQNDTAKWTRFNNNDNVFPMEHGAHNTSPGLDGTPMEVDANISYDDSLERFSGISDDKVSPPTHTENMSESELSESLDYESSILLSSPEDYRFKNRFLHAHTPPMMLHEHSWHYPSPPLALLSPSPVLPSLGLSSMTTQVPSRTHRQPKPSKKDFIRMKLTELQDRKIAFNDLLIYVIDGKDGFEGYQNAFLSKHLVTFLDTLFTNAKARLLMQEWMAPHAIDLVCEKVHVEMENAKPALKMATAEVTPEFIAQWDINKLMDPIAVKTTPTWTRILEAVTESKASQTRPKTSKSRNRLTGRNIISAQVHFLRSFASAKVQIGLGLMAWSCGTSRQMIDVLHHACLSMSYSSINSVLTSLANRSIEQARLAAAYPHALAYDNINVSSSIFVEQRPNAMSKVQSGTFAVIYELSNARPEDMQIQQI